tara:strand:+ start:71 stop:601 length:531 start_codon:yes stop_codon:yes gene_type:complete
MIKWFKRLLLYNVYKNTIEGVKKIDKKNNLGVLKNISIILDNRLGIDKDHFNKIVEVFNLRKNNIKMMIYNATPNDDSYLTTNNYYTDKDISNWGTLNEVLNDFCNTKSDVLINFYDEDDIVLKYISAKTNSNLSVGFKSVDHSLNDLIIEVDAKNIELFTSECIKYLKIFFTTKK